MQGRSHPQARRRSGGGASGQLPRLFLKPPQPPVLLSHDDNSAQEGGLGIPALLPRLHVHCPAGPSRQPRDVGPLSSQHPHSMDGDTEATYPRPRRSQVVRLRFKSRAAGPQCPPTTYPPSPRRTERHWRAPLRGENGAEGRCAGGGGPYELFRGISTTDSYGPAMILCKLYAHVHPEVQSKKPQQPLASAPCWIAI